MTTSAGRVIAIGDIHGCRTALETLLAELAIDAADVVVQLGDIPNRGPDTPGCFDRLIELGRQCRLVAVRGNHDETMLEALEADDLSIWKEVGGDAAVEQYGGKRKHVPDEHERFLREQFDAAESAGNLFVHAAVPAGAIETASRADLRWRHVAGDEAPHSSGKRVVCGHTSQRSGRPLVWPGWACIDTKPTHDGGWLSALLVGTELLVQANEDGRTRTLDLATGDDIDDAHPLALSRLPTPAAEATVRGIRIA